MARTVFEEQREALKEQAKTSRIQQFESNFYSLLDIYINIRKDIVNPNTSFISKVNDELKSVDLSPTRTADKLKKINNTYQEIYYKNKDNISHYLKTIYRIYKTIDEQEDLDINKKYFYSKIVRSQFTEDELFLIYYNAHSSFGKNFRPLILKYNILKHLILISKVEFNCFNNDNILANMLRHSVTTWLDDFFGTHYQLMYDIEIEEPNYSSILEIEGIGKLIITMELDSSENILVNIIEDSYSIRERLHLEEKLMPSFIKHYLYDRLINNQFEELNPTDSIKVLDNTNSVSATVCTDKNINITRDFV
nr:putative phage abortive infection protein [Vibrio scophthalmi]